MLITKSSDDYDENQWKSKSNMKIKFNLDGKLPLNETMEIPTMALVVRANFLENNKFYSQAFLDECL